MIRLILNPPWLTPIGPGKRRLPLHNLPVWNRGYTIRIWYQLRTVIHDAGILLGCAFLSETIAMTQGNWQRVVGRVERGHGVASGVAASSPYPRGTIELQAPIFKSLGLDLTNYVKGTLNISISPRTFELLRPELTFRQVTWTDRHPPEDFSFAQCRVLFHDSTYDSWIYYPHPETKKRNFQAPSTLEVIAPKILGIGYGDRVEVDYDPAAVAVT